MIRAAPRHVSKAHPATLPPPASLASPPRFATLKRGGGALAWLTPLPLACSWRIGHHYGQPCGHSAAPPPSAGGAPTQAAQLPYPDHHPRFASIPAPFRYAQTGRGCARKASRPCPLLAIPCLESCERCGQRYAQ